MKTFIPKYSLSTYLYYPLGIGVSLWLGRGAIVNYQKGIINFYIMLFIIAISFILLSWLYLFTKNNFKAIVFDKRELGFTNFFGTVKRVKKEEIINITPSGLKIKNQIFPITFYFMNNNSELLFCLEDWRKE